MSEIVDFPPPPLVHGAHIHFPGENALWTIIGNKKKRTHRNPSAQCHETRKYEKDLWRFANWNVYNSGNWMPRQ